MEELKGREARILEYMKQEIAQKGYPPTVREICSALGVKSTSTVHKDIANLELKGYLRKDPSKPRALMLVDPQSQERLDFGGMSGALGDMRAAENQHMGNSGYSNAERIDIIDIPVVGRIAAGTPILAEQNIEETFPIPARFAGKGDSFMLTVRGDSMIEAGIFDGDYILVEQQNTARNGEIVVAMIDGFESEATVKTFYREADHVRLQPENSSMSPIIVKDVKILGKVKGVFRYF